MSGAWGGNSQPRQVRAGRNLRYMYESRYGCICHDAHVKAHSGDPGNEFANSIATLTARNEIITTGNPATDHILDTEPMLELDWMWAIWKPEWAHFWTMDGRGLQLPPPPRASEVATLGYQLRMDSREYPQETLQATIEIKIMSANVLSLLPKTKKGQKGHTTMGLARLEAIQRQCKAMNYAIVGIQESRQRQPPKIPQPDYWTFAACAAERGHYGVQLWFARSIPYGWAHNHSGKSTPLYFDKHHFRYLYQSTRILAIQVNAPSFRAVVVSAHAPHTQAEENVAEEWWQELHKAIPTSHRDWDLYLCIDANSRLGDVTSEAVDGHGAETQDRNGTYFHDFLLEHNLWLPATFSRYHVGSTATWQQADHGVTVRGDYVSKVETEVDISLTKEDHHPVCLDLLYHHASRPVRLPQSKLPAVDTDALKHYVEYWGTLTPAMQTELTELTWETDVHTHLMSLQDTVNRHICEPNRRAGTRKIKKHLTDSTWQLVCEKRELRRRMAGANRQAEGALLAKYFFSWRRQRDTDSYDKDYKFYTWSNIVNYKAFKELGKQVTHAVRLDDAAYYDSLARAAGDYDETKDYKNLWRQLKNVLPKHRRKGQTQPLMQQQLDTQWHPHFCELEAGRIIPENSFQTICEQRQNDKKPADVELQDLPTRIEAEASLRGAQLNKTSGPDGIPGEYLKWGAVSLAPHLHDLWMKYVCWQVEPLAAKGGTLVPVYKSGSATEVSNYRGILLLSSFTKRFHAWLRRRTLEVLKPARMDLQLGGFAHQQVAFGGHTVHTLARIAATKGMPFCVIFLDISAAFHHVIRELLFGDGGRGDLDFVMEHLEHDAQRAVRATMTFMPLIQRLKAPPYLQQLLQEVHTDTWYKMPHSPGQQTRQSNCGLGVECPDG